MAVAATVLSAVLASSPALPQAGQRRDCFDDKMVDRCDPRQQERVRTLFGLQSIEEHRDAGHQVRRAFFVEGHGVDLVALAFVRAPGRDPTLSVHMRRQEDLPAPEPMTAPVPEEVWNLVVARSEHFDRELVPLPPRDEEILLCAHSWVYTVEAADPAQGVDNRGATIRRRTEDDCGEGLARVYAWELARLAVLLLPHCALLDRRQHRDLASQLVACSMLSGDRMAAALVLNRLATFDDGQRAGGANALSDLFSPTAIVDWNGQRNGRERPAAFWTAQIGDGEAYLHYEIIEGVSGTQVRAAGELMRKLRAASGTDVQYQFAPVDMIWSRSSLDDAFYVERAIVGPWRDESVD